MSRRFPNAPSPPGIRTLLLVLGTVLSGCDTGGGTPSGGTPSGGAPPGGAPPGSVPSSGAAGPVDPAPAVPAVDESPADEADGASAGAIDSPFADLAGDTLIAPPAPELAVTATPGALTFRWGSPPANTRRTRLFEHDARDGTERLLDPVPVADTPDTEAGVDAGATAGSPSVSARRPIAAHRHDWNALSWRVEHCDADDCRSSRRVPAADGAAVAAAHVLVPAVALADERFGERVALNAAGTVLAVASPVDGQVALYALGPGVPARADPLPRLSGPPSSTRALDLALSADGDTIAVLTGDDERGQAARLLVHERLGEGWITTLDVPAFADATPAVGRDTAHPRVLISAGGERLLAACTGAVDCPVVRYRSTDTGWQSDATVGPDGAGGSDGADQPRTDPEVPLSMTASSSLERVVIATARAGAPPELILHDTASTPESAGVRLALPALAADAPVVVALDASGTHVLVGGLENTALVSRAPVLWRYRLEPDDTPATLRVEDSLRLAAPPERVTTLSLAADATLDTVAFGWGSADAAALVTRLHGVHLPGATRQDDTGERRSALHLPAHASTLAGHPFGATLALDATGSTLAIGVPAAGTRTVGTPGGTGDAGTTLSVGQVLLMRAAGTPRGQNRSAHPDATVRTRRRD